MRFRERLSRWNENIAIWGTEHFGTMMVTYLFILYGLAAALPCLTSYQPQMLYWSNTIQLCSLPLLMVGQRIASNRLQKGEKERMEIQERRALEDHTHLVDIHEVILMHMLAQEETLRKRMAGEEPSDIKTSSLIDLKTLHIRGLKRFGGASEPA